MESEESDPGSESSDTVETEDSSRKLAIGVGIVAVVLVILAVAAGTGYWMVNGTQKGSESEAQ